MSATMDITIATRGVAYVALAGVLLAVAITLNDQRYPATPARKTECSPSVTAREAELARCKTIGAELMRIHPAVPGLGNKEVQDELYKTLFEITKQVEVIKKRLAKLETGGETPDL